jgi:hypothetical protein
VVGVNQSGWQAAGPLYLGRRAGPREMYMMEINLFEQDAPLRFERILIYPYPDLRRLWVRIWLPARLEDGAPNVELIVYNPGGTENNGLVLLAQTDTRLNHTLHLKDPVLPDEVYRVEALLSVGLSQDAQQVDRQTFDLTLAFRNPEAGEPGFGIDRGEPETGEAR